MFCERRVARVERGRGRAKISTNPFWGFPLECVQRAPDMLFGDRWWTDSGPRRRASTRGGRTRSRKANPKSAFLSTLPHRRLWELHELRELDCNGRTSKRRHTVEYGCLATLHETGGAGKGEQLRGRRQAGRQDGKGKQREIRPGGGAATE